MVDGATADVGSDLSMAVDLGSNTRHRLLRSIDAMVAVARCDDLGVCRHPRTTSPSMASPRPIDSSIALDANDFPVVSYFDNSNANLGWHSCGSLSCVDPTARASNRQHPIRSSANCSNTSIVLDVYDNPTMQR